MSSFRDRCDLCQRSVCFHGFLVTFSFSNSQPFASLNCRLRRWPAFALGRGERFLCGEPF